MSATSPPYRPISDYALIGNTHTAALVGRDGSIDWCCLPHFDSGAVFCRLLDTERGGFLRLGPAGEHSSSRRYGEDGPVLETEFTVPGGRVRVTDFMHSARIAQSRLGIDDPHCHRLLRRVDGLAGCVTLELTFRPTFDFARKPAEISLTPDGARASATDEILLLRVTPAAKLKLNEGTVSAHLDVRAGERLWVVLSHGGAQAGNDSLVAADPEALLEETRRHWREWQALCTYEGPYVPQVRRSAMVLKLLSFAPTGALVAAPTSSLPEQIGGVRNWDYRYCWLRDAALVLHALMSIGYHEAAMDFFRWLEALGESEREGDLQIMYRLDGGRDLPEHELHHLAGYRGSAPVRTGNAAVGQKQLDVYGHVLDAALRCLEEMNEPIRPGLRAVLRRLADRAAACWREPDQGLWEVRGPPQQFVSSKLMCWVALDRALRLEAAGKLQGDVPGWRRERDAVRAAILEQGYNAAAGAFTQVLGGNALDASALLMPLVGFLPATDERMISTVRCIAEQLSAHGLVCRYRSEDGLAGGEATFAICSFWMVDNLALQGRLDEARALFERIAAFSSDLGLLSEQIDPVSGELLGNYPQGFTHLALIQSALTIDAVQRRQREGAEP
ncbi:MAG: glycoside hydrolase family 15 protein [Methylibium sp.]|uniref:glycoside hydrolase family 15 protein n=1 Tax=Methylibium sp. TaxID=2067992 RepID=UPI0018146EA6|nr:glycoside hydrolase family 15 protein [Methylibium sp.]MBA3598234.1 glycoside hydrolase family 15 protein [Methylibium sp.]